MLSATTVTYIDAAGDGVDEGTSNAATVYWFSDFGDGRLIVPPADFRFDEASDAQLEAWGYPPRDDGAGGDWTTDDGVLRAQAYDESPTMCSYPGRQAYVANDIWAGVQVYEKASVDLRRVYGTARIPTFDNSKCSGTTGVLFWVGIGNTGLIQNGWATDDGAPQGMFPWWEFVGPGNTGNCLTTRPGVGQANDLVKSDTYVNKLTTPERVQFNWTDVTTGLALTPYVTSTVHGNDGIDRPTSVFYDGSQAEIIDERDGSLPIRGFSSAGWKDMYAVRAGSSAVAVGSYSSHQTTYIKNSSGVHLLGLAGSGLSSPTQMTADWAHCS